MGGFGRDRGMDMDVASMAAAIMGMQAGRIQMAAAAAMLKNSADSGKSALALLQAGQNNTAQLANLAAGVGQNVNITA